MTTAALTPIERIQQHAGKLKEDYDDRETVGRGRKERLSAAASLGDYACQGDLTIVVAGETPPDDFVLIGKRSSKEDKNRLAGMQPGQLVPGETQGAKHCLDSLDGVTLYIPPDWPAEAFRFGPYFKTTKERTILHPVHPHVVIPAGMAVQIEYQRNYDAETKEARRSQD